MLKKKKLKTRVLPNVFKHWLTLMAGFIYLNPSNVAVKRERGFTCLTAANRPPHLRSCCLTEVSFLCGWGRSHSHYLAPECPPRHMSAVGLADPSSCEASLTLRMTLVRAASGRDPREGRLVCARHRRVCFCRHSGCTEREWE